MQLTYNSALDLGACLWKLVVIVDIRILFEQCHADAWLLLKWLSSLPLYEQQTTILAHSP